MAIKRIAVLGSGIMGHGIAQVSATAGYEVYMRDVDALFLERAMANMEKSLNRMIKARENFAGRGSSYFRKGANDYGPKTGGTGGGPGDRSYTGRFGFEEGYF